MAQPPKPLDYPISKIVMEHMRANKRYLLAACCPALRNLHTQVPLKIDHLILDTNGFTVDHVAHTLHTFVSNLNHIPRAWRVIIPPQGLPYDIDRFGHRHEDDAVDGDIVIQLWLVNYQKWLGARQVPRVALDEPEPVFPDVRVMEIGRHKFAREMEKVDRARRRCRVKTFLQYNTHATPVRLPQGVQLAEAVRNLTRNFFAANKVLVNVLEIPFSFGVLRLPRNLRFHVASLKTGLCAGEVFNAISPILIADPLRKLAITASQEEDPIFEYEILHTVAELTLRFDTEGPWTDTLIGIQVATVEVVGYEVTLQELVIVGKHWINHPRPAGHKMSFELDDVGTLLDRVREHLRAQRGTFLIGSLPPEYPHCGFVQANLETDFVIHVQKVDQADGDPRWLLIFEMMHVGFAQAFGVGEV